MHAPVGNFALVGSYSQRGPWERTPSQRGRRSFLPARRLGPVRAAAVNDMATILCAVDFSECSKQALRWAGALAVRRGTSLTVLHAVDPLLAYAARSRARIDLLDADAQAQLHAFAAEAFEGCPVQPSRHAPGPGGRRCLAVDSPRLDGGRGQSPGDGNPRPRRRAEAVVGLDGPACRSRNRSSDPAGATGRSTRVYRRSNGLGQARPRRHRFWSRVRRPPFTPLRSWPRSWPRTCCWSTS